MLNTKIKPIIIKKILVFLFVLILFNFNNVNADNTFEITSFSNFTDNLLSKKCNGKNFCATDTVAGVRITLTNGNGTKVSGTVTKNFWQSANVASSANNNADVHDEALGLAGYKNATNLKMINFSCTVSGVTNPANCIKNVSLNERLSRGNKLYFGTELVEKAGMYPGFINSLDSINVPMIVEELKGSATITNYNNIYLKLEPIYILAEKYNYNPNQLGAASNKIFQSFYVGTSKEIINNWGLLNWDRYYGTVSTSAVPSSDFVKYAGVNYDGAFNKTNMNKKNSHSAGYYYVSGGCNGTITGYWNVIRNYIVAMYVDCSSTRAVACYDKNIHGDLSSYNALSAPKDANGNFIREGTYSKYCDKNNINQLINKYKSGNGLGVGYVKVSDYIYGTLEISKIKQSNGELITSSPASFNIYSTNNCTGSAVTIKTNGGKVSHKLPAGAYSIKEISAPTGYIKNNECRPITISSGNITSVNIDNEASCSTRLKEIKGLLYTASKEEINKILELYKDYPTFNGLLNFLTPSCSVVNCNTNMEASCLSANNDMKENILFSNYNLSCYDYKYQNEIDGYTAFCKDMFVLENKLKTPLGSLYQYHTEFYSSAGRFLIKQAKIGGSTILQFTNRTIADTKQENTILSPYIANAKIERKCYIKNANTNSNGDIILSDTEYRNYFGNIPSVNLYFGDADADGNVDELIAKDFSSLSDSEVVDDVSLKLESLKNEAITKAESELNDVKNKVVGLINPFKSISVSKIYGYELRPFYIQKFTGKVSLDLNNPLPNSKLATGLITGFYSSNSSGSIPFKFIYGDKEYNSDDCKYQTNSEIIEYDDEHAQTGKLQLEFRAVDSKEPFARETNSNWCDSLGNCNETNLNTLLYIKLRTNSYGMNPCGQKQKPLYTITLTSSDIQKIKDYNESNSYDNYSDSPYCDANGNCMNSFLHQLTEKTLDGSVDLTNGLTINKNDHTVCDIKQKLQDELNKLDSDVRSKIEEELSELEKLGNIFE